MKLYLMRHGEAEVENIQRPLNERGLAEVRKMADFLAKHKIPISQIYHSEKLRAQQTAREIAKKISPEPQMAVLPGLHPNDPVDGIAIDCNEWQEDTLLVSHLPFIAKLASQLVFQTEDKPFFDFQTAAILCLEKFGPNQWYFSWFIRPDLLL